MKRTARRRPARSLMALKRQRTARLTRIAARAALLQRRGQEDAAYTLVCDEFVQLGGIYVKFLQGVLLNSPVLKHWHNADKFRIFEGLPPEPIDILALLRAELGPERAAQIARLQTEPFAAGSFGQVYYGELHDGRPIIVKALRPQVRELLLHDLRLLGLFSRFFVGRQYRDFGLQLDGPIRDFRRATLAETDYVQEAQFAHELYEADDHPNVIIPRTYRELCTPNLIVQDYVNGISCAEVLKQTSASGVDPQQYVREQLGSNLALQLEYLGIALMNDCFSRPRVMGDPHPGNVRLLPGDQVALIDFGIAAPAPRNRPAFYGLIREWAGMYRGSLDIPRLFEQFLRVFVTDLYRAFKKLTSLYPHQNALVRRNMMQNVGGIINELFETETEAIDLTDIVSHGRMLRLFNQVINKGNRLGLVMKFADTDLLRAAQTYMSLVESLGLRTEVLAVVFDTVVRDQQVLHPEFETTGERQVSTSQALEIVNRWLERVAGRDPQLFQQLLERLAGGGLGGVQLAESKAGGTGSTLAAEPSVADAPTTAEPVTPPATPSPAPEENHA